MQIHTFHQSAAIWFYWLYTIISKNIPLLSDSIQSIDRLFHLNKTRPCYQTLHYYFRKYPTPLCKSIHSINKLQYDFIDYTLSFRKISPCWVIPYKWIGCTQICILRLKNVISSMIEKRPSGMPRAVFFLYKVHDRFCQSLVESHQLILP